MKTKQEKVLEQIALMEVIRDKANINIVACGNCGDILLHKLEDEEIECPHCDFKSDPCDFPDYLYVGMEIPEEFKIDFSPKLQDAIDKVTPDFNGITHGEEIELNDEYHLYHYTEDDIVVINRVKDDEGNDGWTEVMQVMSDGEKLTFEKL